MARHDVYAAPEGGFYLLDLQTDLLDGLATRVVAPLLPLDAAPKPAAILNPVFEIAGAPHVMAAQFLSAVPASILGRPVANLSACAETITRAVDMVFQGF